MKRKKEKLGKSYVILVINTEKSAYCLTLWLPRQTCNSPYCQQYYSYIVSSENLVLDQLIILILTFFFILITYLIDIVLIL